MTQESITAQLQAKTTLMPIESQFANLMVKQCIEYARNHQSESYSSLSQLKDWAFKLKQSQLVATQVSLQVPKPQEEAIDVDNSDEDMNSLLYAEFGEVTCAPAEKLPKLVKTETE